MVGANITDTVASPLPQALIVEVHDSTGALVPAGTVVRFSSVLRSPPLGVEVYVQPLTTQSFGTFATGSTDAAGRASVLVKFGTLAGTGRIAISVPTLALLDTARYTITPGNPARVSILPADTLVYAGKSFAFRGGVTDQFGNTRAEPVTWTVSTAGVSVSTSGVLGATTTGRYSVIAAAGAGTDTSFVTVVPTGRLTATQFSNGGPVVSMLDLDGSNLRVLASVADGGIGVNPVWMPSRGAIIYSTYTGGLQQLYIVDTLGVSQRFFPTGIPNVTHQAEPRPSFDGKWLFFTAFDSRCTNSDYCLYRSRIDGSQPELIGTAAMSGGGLRPAPSPDGSRVAFVQGSTIRVLDVATKTLATWTVPGTSPSWSPDGTEIAYVSVAQNITVVRADGSSSRTLTGGRTYLNGPVSWTADGKYLLARSASNVYDLIDTKTGIALPLIYAISLFVLSVSP